jgi:hypothetical protein
VSPAGAGEIGRGRAGDAPFRRLFGPMFKRGEAFANVGGDALEAAHLGF